MALGISGLPESTVEPQIIPKRTRDANGIEDNVLAMYAGETVRKLRLPNPFVAKGLPSPRGMKFSIKPFVPCYENKTRSQELNLDNKCFQQL